MPELWRLIDLDTDRDSLFRLPYQWMETPFRPSLDVTRTEGQLMVTAELPGIDPEKDIDITLEEGYLTIGGEKSEQKEVTENNRVVRERRYGSFMRRLPVPDGVSADKVTAQYIDGVLTVTVELPEETRPLEPQKIPVSSSTA